MPSNRNSSSETDRFAFLSGLKSKSRILIATDFDGTLCPIVSHPAEVSLGAHARNVLQDLAEAPGVTLAIVTGRSLSDITKLIPVPALFAGNHGLEIEGKGLHFRHAGAEECQKLLREVCAGLKVTLDRWEGAWIEEKGLTATVHFRQATTSEHNTIGFAVRAHLQRFEPLLGVRSGHKAIEIYPNLGWNKGSAVSYIRCAFGLGSAGCVCIGDDETDETMFGLFADDICVRVGDCQTKARFQVSGPPDVIELLERISAWRGACTVGTS
jgi:trehalose 6-phosphate phosphatase